MNADIQDMEERIMMEQRLLKEVTEEIISLTHNLWGVRTERPEKRPLHQPANGQLSFG